MSEKPLSTFDRMMQNPACQQRFEEGYKEFLLSELVHAMMDDDEVSVRKLAQEIGVSPTTIQNVRSGKQNHRRRRRKRRGEKHARQITVPFLRPAGRSDKI